MSKQEPIVVMPALTDDLAEDEPIYWLDVLVQDLVIIEFKGFERFNPIFEAQVLTCLKMIGKKVGLPISLSSHSVKEGSRRFIL